MASRRLEVEIVGDSRSLERAFGRAAKSSSGLGGSLRTLGKVAAVGVGAAFAGLAATLKVGFDELAEGQKVTAQTNAVLKSTGGIANVTAKQVAALAESQSRLTGIDDELIQASENLLLTFKNVRNEVGAGNAVFDRATKAALDLSTAGFGSVESASKMMGKALNDPIKGMTALGRAGVTFSADQKKAIEALVESGRALEAQKLILKEVESQVGGSAKAYGETLPGQLSKLKNAFEETAGGIAQTLMPYLMRLLDWTNRNMPTIQRVIQTTLNAVVAVINFLAPIIGTLIGWFQRLHAAAVQYWPPIRAIIEGVINWFKANVLPTVAAVINGITALWRRFGDNIMSVVRPAFQAVATIIQTVLRNIRAIIEGVLALIRGDWGAAWEALKTLASNSLSGLKKVLGTILTGLVPAVLGWGKDIGAAIIRGIAAGMGDLLNWLLGQAGDIVSKVKDKLMFWKSPPEAFGRFVGESVVNGMIEGFGAQAERLKGEAGQRVRDMIDAAAQAIEAGRSRLGNALTAVASLALEAFDKVTAQLMARLDAKQSQLTAAEKKLAAMEERRAAESRERAKAAAAAGVSEAEAALAAAMAGGDPEAVRAAQEQLLTAQRAYQDAVYEIKRAALEKQAALERQQRDARLAKERQHLADKREANRRHFEEYLEMQAQKLQQGLISYETYQRRVIAKAKEYEVPWKNAATKLGSALAAGLREAMQDVEKAAEALAQAITDRLNRIKVTISVNVSGSSSGGSGGGGGSRSSLVNILNATGRQHGGPVRAGHPYVVGERRPELFVPTTSGRIMPSVPTTAAGGSTIVFNFPNYVGSQDDLMRMVKRGLALEGRRNVTALGGLA